MLGLVVAMNANSREIAPPSATPSSKDSETLYRLLSGRYSCRAYLPEPVPRATISEILRLAQRTASWCNSQPWQVTITCGAGTERFRAAYYEHALDQETPDFDFPKEYAGVYLKRRRECGFQLYDSVGIAHGDREASARQSLENYRFFGAPHVAIITSEALLGVYGALDCGAYAANFLLAAHSLGVASIVQASLASHPQLIREHFALPQNRLVVCGISFGFADQQHPANRFRTNRARVEEAVTWVDA